MRAVQAQSAATAAGMCIAVAVRQLSRASCPMEAHTMPSVTVSGCSSRERETARKSSREAQEPGLQAQRISSRTGYGRYITLHRIHSPGYPCLSRLARHRLPVIRGSPAPDFAKQPRLSTPTPRAARNTHQLTRSTTGGNPLLIPTHQMQAGLRGVAMADIATTVG
jgi:hypothetical protein